MSTKATKATAQTNGRTNGKVLMLAQMGLLTAIIVVLQLLALSIRFGVFSITLVLAPIIIGAALHGPKAGAWLGFVFGVVVLISGDAAPFMAINVFGTVATVLLKGTLAGLCAGLAYKLIEKKNSIAAVVAAGIVSPVVNTGIFLLGCVVFFLDTIKLWAAGAGFENVGTYMIVGFVGLNFLVELAVNLVLSTAIVAVLKIVKKN